ncbi:hypothetical protein PBY51_009839 [Eleginops maclovinus]|uniref:Uncharacterized protein n=1 Tax=Eleginops maclovinus TaxID=56733 RepID=A0AAN7XZN2_ELEMC|nr:hypothetical protein PBY51_009839 [Eleginops maclovinus]
MPTLIHFGIPSELFFFLAPSLNAILPVTGLCQLSVLVLLPLHRPPACPLPQSRHGWAQEQNYCSQSKE